MDKIIYLDYASATPVLPAVQRKISFLNSRLWANPSSTHKSGLASGKIIDEARTEIAKILNCKKEEIIFTSSGSEANNLAILGFARANKRSDAHIITTKIEHHSVLRACQKLETEGFRVTYLDVGSVGLIDIEQFLKSLKRETILISIGYANNEIGVIQPISQIAKRMANLKNRPAFHTDACQAANYLNLAHDVLGVDMITLNASKVYGPKGVGCLFVRNTVKLEPIIYGGDQERGLRAGTENPALIAGFAQALKISQAKRKAESNRLTKLRDWAIGQILNSVSLARLNGHATERLPNNINISFPDTDGEMLMLALDKQGIEVSTGAACTAISTEPSHVIKALGLPVRLAKGNIRISLGRQTTKKELEIFLKTLTYLVNSSRP